ncbi:MAG: 2-oxoglutarate dehydrogenase E1 component, partial [Verrucomicrobiales bacterium]|nr:2-oxoglutarate dehydrogenase E1 component [Verrucomicrobiales bacterium]
MNATIASRPNADLLEEKYAEWKVDPRSVEPTWAAFFEGFELGMEELKRKPGGAEGVAEVGKGGDLATELALGFRAKVVSLVYHYRTVGHTKAWLNPLGDAAPEDSSLVREMPEFSAEDLEREVETQFYRSGERMKLSRLVGLMEATYCGKLGFEFMHLHAAEVRNWLRGRIEARVEAPEESAERKRKVLASLVEAESFEQFLHRKFVGQKRFSLEG